MLVFFRSNATTLGLLGAHVVLAAWLLPHTIQPGDAGEFATVMLRGGLPHPSGYPWMRMLGAPARVLEALGLAPVRAAAWPCVLLAIAGWAMLQRTLASAAGSTHRPAWGPATLTVAWCSTSALFVTHTFDSEVWGPLLFFFACMSVATARTSNPMVLGLVLGLAVTHHLTLFLLLPMAVTRVWPSPFGWRALVRAAGLGLMGGIVGLSFYLTLLIPMGDGWSWGSVDSLPSLAAHVLRRDYGLLTLSTQNHAFEPWPRLARACSSLAMVFTLRHTASAWLGLGLVVGLIAAWLGVGGHRNAWQRGMMLSFLLSGCGFPLLQNLAPEHPPSRWILERFDQLTLLTATGPLTWVLARWTQRVRERFPGPRTRWAMLGMASMVVATQLAQTLDVGPPAQLHAAERYGRNVLQTPRSTPAVVLGTDDHRTFPLLFLQRVMGVGSNVLYIDAHLWTYPWYRTRVWSAVPSLPHKNHAAALMRALLQHPSWRNVPIYLTNVFSKGAQALPRVPEGVLWRVIAPHQASDLSLDDMVARHLQALMRYDMPPMSPAFEDHPFEHDLDAVVYIRTKHLIGLMQRESRPDLAAQLQATVFPSVSDQTP